MTGQLPTIEDESRPYWEAAAQGRLVFQRCAPCGHAYLYPRPFCPSCWSTEVTWEQASGRAVLHTWSVVHRNDLPAWRDHVPYVVALVDLAEGPRMATNLVGCTPEDVTIGMDLVVDFLVVGDGDRSVALPVFRPAPTS